MKKRLLVSLLFLALMMTAFANAAQTEKKSGTARSSGRSAGGFQTLMQQELAAWETLDPANAAPFYAKEADRLFFDIAPLKYTGWAEYAEGVKKFLSPYASIKFTLGRDVQVRQQGKLAWGAATFHLDAVKKNGSKEAFDGRWTLLWERRGSDWLVVHEHTSLPLPMPAETRGQPLYKRLGGYDALAAVTDDFIGRLATDPQLSKFFVGHSSDSLQRIRQLVVDQLCAATGGPCFYIGRDMKTSHAGLGISESDWQVAVNHLVATLDKFNVPSQEKGEVIAAIAALKKDIVRATAGGQK